MCMSAATLLTKDSYVKVNKNDKKQLKVFTHLMTRIK